MRKWPHIEGFSTLRRNIERVNRLGEYPTVAYKAKIKLDGTNAAIRFQSGAVCYQSRTQDITPEKDNAGFARWASTVAWPASLHIQGKAVVVHGEWAGKGVQTGTSVASVEKKFFIFSIEISDGKEDGATGSYVTEPDKIREMLGGFTHPDVHVLPWHWKGVEYVVDFNKESSIRGFATFLNNDVLEVEACDPYIKETFGVSGVGEGLVLYPQVEEDMNLWALLVFKAKGEKHRVKAATVAVEVDPEFLASVDAFVAAFVTEARCQQGLTVACNGDRHPSKTGAFIGWMGRDIERESKEELAVSGLTWKQVAQPVANAARKWFQA